MTIDKLVLSQQRIEKIAEWVKSHQDYSELSMAVEEIIGGLSFGVKADKFENAFDQLGAALGFACERPDREWKEGPDNLWVLRDGEYLLVECKSEVHMQRADIAKGETGQMNNAVAWFNKNYSGASSQNVMIIPTNKMSSATAFAHDARIMKASGLVKLHTNVRAFFKEFQPMDFQNLSHHTVQKWLGTHSLSTESIPKEYTVSVRL